MNTPLVKGLIGAGAVVIGLLGFGLLTQPEGGLEDGSEEGVSEAEGGLETETQSVKPESGSGDESESESDKVSVKKVDDDLTSIPPETVSPQPSPIRKKRRPKETESVKIIRV